MSNRHELKKARDKYRKAAIALEAIEALPRRVGSLVQWGANGVIWRREGDDYWVPLHKSNDYIALPEYGGFPSEHVAMTWQGWTAIKSLPEPIRSSSTGSESND